jgi:hypothetical protein
VQVDVAHLRLDSGRTGTSTHERPGRENDKNEERNTHEG